MFIFKVKRDNLLSSHFTDNDIGGVDTSEEFLLPNAKPAVMVEDGTPAHLSGDMASSQVRPKIVP